MNKKSILTIREQKRIENQQHKEYYFKSWVAQQFEQAKNGKIPPFKNNYQLNIKETDSEWVFVATDLHYLGNKKQLNLIFNQWTSIIKKLIKEEKPKKLRIMILGDMVEGVLRKSALLEIKKGIVGQCIDFCQCFLSWINYISKLIPIKILFISESNHSELRLFDTKRSELKNEDMSLLMAAYICDSEVVKNNSQIEFISGRIINENICGYVVHLTHGDKINNKYLQNYQTIHNKHIDYLFLGHFHTFKREPIIGSYKYYKGRKILFDKEYIKFPTCKQDKLHYEDVNQYETTPSVCLVKFTNLGLKYIIRESCKVKKC